MLPCKSLFVCGLAFLGATGAWAKPPKHPISPRLAKAIDPSATLRTLVFEEPLLAARTPTPKENVELALALEAYTQGGRLEELGPVETYLAAHPGNPWELALLVNIGLMHRHVGNVSSAIKAWERAWGIGKGLKDPKGMALAHRALGELLEVNTGLGQQQVLESWVKTAEGQSLAGLLTEKLSLAKESLAYMRNSPETAFRCGPTALAYLKASLDPRAFADPHIQHFLSSEKGSSLAMNAAWAQQIGLKLQMAKRGAGGEFPVPSMLHFRSGHFAAAMYAKDGRVLIQDPALGDTWVPQRVLEHETSGYALIPAGDLPKGWIAVSKVEGESVWGKGAWGPGRPDDTRPDSRRFESSLLPGTAGLRVTYLANLVDLSLDIPAVDYTPIRGPRVDLSVTYNHREYGQPEVFDYCNLGSKWTFTFLTCLKDDTTNPDFNVTLCNPGGGGLELIRKLPQLGASKSQRQPNGGALGSSPPSSHSEPAASGNA